MTAKNKCANIGLWRTASNPLDARYRIMKKLLTILCLVMVASCSQEPEILTGPFLIRDGIKYDQKTNKPIEGITQKFYENGQLNEQAHYKNGQLQGIWEEFHENGQLKVQRNYKDGKIADGLAEEYHEDGQLEVKENYKDGEVHGLSEEYHENGQLSEKGNYKNDIRHGLLEQYYENGQEYSISPTCYQNGEEVDMSNC